MSRLNRKFLISIGLVLLVIGIMSLYINSNFVERYYLHEEKQQLRTISDRLLSSNGAAPEAEEGESADGQEDVIIVTVEHSPDNEILNQRLSEAFHREGISLKKYWLWDRDQTEVEVTGRKMKIYDQDQLNYSLLAEYLLIGDDFVAVAKIVPSLDRTLVLINKVNTAVFTGMGLLLFLCISLLVHRIIAPLGRIRGAANAIANLDFATIDLKTGDELELLAEDINSMSLTLQESHRQLTEKNRQMEELLSNVSHDLKTPITLIKMYTCGIRDGLDDGTFLDTVITQNQRMEQMVERLLSLAKVRQQKGRRQTTDLTVLLKQQIREYHLENGYGDVVLNCRIEDEVTAVTDPEAVYLIYSNMITNAMKYSKDGRIDIKLYADPGGAVFEMANPVSNAAAVDPVKIWQPFYVAEESRNQEMSGTGLGLSIVKAASEKNGIACCCLLHESVITFTFIFPVTEPEFVKPL